MKKTALVLALVLLVSSFGVMPVFAASWNGHEYSTTCNCDSSCIYTDSNGYFNFQLDCSKGDSNHYLQIKPTAMIANNVDLEFELRMQEFSEDWYAWFDFGTYRTRLQFHEGRLFWESGVSSFSAIAAPIDKDWHTYRIEKRGSTANIYMDGGLLTNINLISDSNSPDQYVLFYASPDEPTALKFQLKSLACWSGGGLRISSDKSSYSEGENVTLTATFDSTSWSRRTVDFYVNKIKLGSAKTNYMGSTASYTVSGGLPVGTYSAYAIYDGTQYSPVEVVVKDSRTATISATETVNYGGGASLSVSASKSTDIDEIEYYVNGVLVGKAGTSFTTSALPIGTNSVYADVYYIDGACIRTNMAYVNVTAANVSTGTSLNMGQEYDLSYTCIANSGSMELTDGIFKLALTHSASKLSYLTSAGQEEIATTTGKFRIVASAGIAEVYRDGQFLVSFRMPLDSSAASIKYQNTSSVTLGGSGVKAAVYSKKIDGETNIFDENINMGINYSLEFDKKNTSPETIQLYDGEFEISLKIGNGITVLEQRDPGATKRERVLSSTVKTGYYRVTVFRGLGQLFINNEFIASFTAPRSSHKTEIKRTLTSGSSSILAIKETDDIYYYEDDFSEDNVLGWADYWYCATDLPATTSDTIVTGSSSNGALALTGTGTYVLDAIAENPTFKWKTTTAPSKYGVALRYRDENHNIKLVYNGSWNIIQTEEGSSTTIKTASGPTTGNFVLSVKDNKLTLTCGSTTIFSNVALSFNGNGKMGFVLFDNSSLTVDDVSYAGNGKVNSGVNYGAWIGGELSSTIEVWQDSKGEAIVRGGETFVMKTQDKGETWTKYEAKDLLSATVNLQSGGLLTVGAGGDHDTAFKFSSADQLDHSASNAQYYRSIQASGRGLGLHDAMHGRLVQATDKRVFWSAYVYGDSEIDNELRVYYSTNEGQSWSETSTEISSFTLDGMVVSEPQIVELPNGDIRLYMRTDAGYIYYIDSTDNGQTFNLDAKPSQLMAPAQAFSITRDYTADTPTYYAIWGYNVVTADMASHSGPRNRVAMAVSHDCETWEYIMEMDDRGTYSKLWHANPNIRAINGVIYASVAYLNGAQYTSDRLVRALTFVVDTTKMKTRPRFANTSYTIPDYHTVHRYADNICVIPKTTGVATIYGQAVPTIVNKDGLVDIDVVAKAFGATVTTTSTGVTLDLAGGSVSFTADDINLSTDKKFIRVAKCAEAFGRKITTTEDSYIIGTWVLTPVYVTEVEGMVEEKPKPVRECIEEFEQINSATALKEFFENNQNVIGTYDDYSDENYESMYQTYVSLDKSNINNFKALVDNLETLTDVDKAERLRFLTELNTASTAGDADKIEELLTETYAHLIPFEINMTGLKNSRAVYEKMTGITYYSLEEVESIFYSAFEAQKFAEEGKSNAVILSTVSKYFDGWSVIRSNKSGGVKLTLAEENVAWLSAYAGFSAAGKTSVESEIDGYVYQEPGKFGINVEKVGDDSRLLVDSATGTVTFNNVDGSFTIKDPSDKAAISNTIITVFDMTKPTGRITGTFCDGDYSVNIDFTADRIGFDGTSYVKLPKELLNVDKLTYRIEKSVYTVAVMVKAASAPDTDYIVVGTKQITPLSTDTYWYVKFASDEAVTTISNIGIYSAIAGVRYDTSGYTLVDDYYYATGGESGHTMSDLVALGSNVIYAASVDENGYLDITPGQYSSVVEFKENSKTLNEFDRAEIDLTLSVDTGTQLGFYCTDGSGYKVSTSNLGFTSINGMSTNYNASWKTGDFYSLKLICQDTEMDPTRRNDRIRPVWSLYVKGPQDSKWICLGSNILMDVNLNAVDENSCIHFTYNSSYTGKHIRVKELGIKTYKRNAGDYSYINNAVNMPLVDYNFTFDYMRRDANSNMEFSIGGKDYQQTFVIGPTKVSIPDSTASAVSATINEDRWYRFYGTVDMVPENKSAGTKNEITMYMADDAGNVTVLADSVPMNIDTGGEGVKFKVANTRTADVELKNIRVYNGKALDVISGTSSAGKATVIADFLNDKAAMSEGAVVLTSVYDNSVLSGANIYNLTNNLDPYDAERLTITNVEYNSEISTPQIKIFTWKDLINLVPLTAPVIVE